MSIVDKHTWRRSERSKRSSTLRVCEWLDAAERAPDAVHGVLISCRDALRGYAEAELKRIVDAIDYQTKL